MNNYHYIICGLPDLMPEFESKAFSYDKLSEVIREKLSSKDIALLDLFESGYKEENLSKEFYEEMAKSKNRFVSLYYDFDRTLRNTKVSYVSKELSKNPEDFYVGEFNDKYEEYPKVISVFKTKNIIEREKSLDRLVWDKISTINTFQYFNMDVILGFMAKAKLVERWSKLDKEEGKIIFKKLVEEVRGTYKGVEL